MAEKKKLTEAEKLKRKQEREAIAAANKAAGVTPTPRKRSPSSYSVQTLESVQIGQAAEGEPTYRDFWADISGSHASPKAAKAAISALAAAGKYRILRIMETVKAEPRTGLELSAA